MSKFTDYREAVESEGGVVLDWKIELLTTDGATLLATDQVDDLAPGVLLWGATLEPVDFDNARVSQRSAALTVPISGEALICDFRGSLLHPGTKNVVRVSAGLWAPTGSTWWPLATFFVESVEATWDGLATLSIQLVDATNPLQSDTEHSFAFTYDEPVENVVARLLAEVFDEEDFTVTETGWTTPAAVIQAGTNRAELVNQLLEGCGHELAADPLGKIFTREIPTAAGDLLGERWDYGTGGIPIERITRQWTVRSPQGWKVEGGTFEDAASGVEIVVWDQDPSSEGYFEPGREATVGTSRLPYIRTAGQGALAGYAQLRRHGTGPLVVDFESIPNPAIAEGDLVKIVVPELKIDHLCRVLAFSLPVQVDGLMSVRARAVFDPALGYEPPVDRNEGCIFSYFDTFTRATNDENLENLPESAGSPDWTEIGYSWAAVGGKAIQRYDGGWSMAIYNTPSCRLDHWVEMDVALVPAGKFIGPVIRSSGQFDGYAALVDSAGNISLQIWLNKGLDRVLASFASGASAEGKKLRITAIGSTISVQLSGETVISVTDSRRTGSYGGMLARGGRQNSTAPQADRWELNAG